MVQATEPSECPERDNQGEMSMKAAVVRTPDRRVRRTRRLLREALVSLILERGWDAVSVLDVCARADVGRSTFYVHFADKEALLLSGFDDLHATLGAESARGTGPFPFIEGLIAHAAENHRLFRAVVGRRSGQAVQRRFRDVVIKLVLVELEQLGVDKQDRAFVARYASGGLVECLIAWLERRSAVDAATLAANIRRLTLGAIASMAR